jgi:hypothetical protein
MKKININVPEPCHENWLLMTPDEKGRYCNSCQKVVIDFSMMSDAEIIQYFQKYRGNTCGNFTVSQLGRDIREPATPARKRYWGMLLSLLVTFFAACKSRVESVRGKIISSTTQTAPEELLIMGDMMLVPGTDTSAVIPDTSSAPLSQVLTKGEVELSSRGLVSPVIYTDVMENTQVIDTVTAVQEIIIAGKVMSVEGEPIPGATIHVKELNKMTSTNAKGDYSISLQQPIELTLVTSSVGFEVYECKVKTSGNTREDIILKPSENELAGVVVVGYAATRTGRIVSRCSSSVKGQNIVEKSIDTVKQLLPPAMVTVFPNPATRGSVVNVRIANPSRYIIQLLDNNGKIIQTKEVTTTTKKEVIEVDLSSSLAAGIYFISLLDKQLQKKHSAKIVIR